MRKDGKRNFEKEAGVRRSSTKSANEFSSGKPCSKPKVTVNPSQIGIADSTEESKEESKGMLKKLCHTCLPTALATTKKPPNARNQKEDSRVTFIMSFLKKK